jgi:hypothetical protein
VSGIPVIENPDQKYSQIGDEMNRRSNETNGSFVIKPFNVDTGYGSANYLIAKVSAGSGYAQGSVGIRRGTDTRTADSQLITTNYGNYVIVNEYAGVFDFTKLEEVAIFDAPQQAVSKKSFMNTAFTGNQIGTANLRAVQFLTGLEGTPAAQHEVYLFNIRMNPGKSFSTNAKALVFNANGNKGFADLVSSDIQNGERRTMIWGFGNRAIKNLKDEHNNINTQYVFRQKSTSTLNSNGTISLTLTTAHAGGANKFPYGTGITLGDGLENDFVVVALANTETAVIGNVSVTAATTQITGAPSGKPFSGMFSVGDYVRVASDIRRVIGVDANNLVVDTGFSATNSTAPYTRFIPAGYTFPFNDSMVGARTIQINSETQATLSVGTSVAGVLGTSIPVAVYHNVLRSNMVPVKKNILKNYVVNIDTATHPAGANGPWPLGWTDVHDLKNVFVTSGNTFITSGNDLLSLFNFDTGQADTHYGIGFLYLKPGASIPAGSKLTVVADVFQTDTTQGVGFYSIDSYPIDDNNTANTTAITTANLPVYVSSTGRTYALRDSVDCRPSKAQTANYAPFPRIDLATTNPTDTNAFTTDTVGTYVPAPDMNFETDITYYVGRKDMIYFSNRGFVKIKEGVANEYPQTPHNPDDGMAICVVQIPPYPSLSSAENADVAAKNKMVYNKIRDTSYAVAVSIVTNKRYRMQDIGTIDQRVSRLEYYQALNLLEQATTSLQVPDAQGLDRFKNGIFVDPFTNFSLGDVGNPEFKIAIDSNRGIARPYYNEERPELEFSTGISSGVVKTGRLVTLPYTAVPYVGQPYATNLRNAACVQNLWTGSMSLFPAYGHNIDKVAAAAVQVSLDMAAPWQDFANSPFGMSWGDWRVTNTDTSSQSNITNQQAINGVLATTTETTTTTTTSNARSGQKLNIDVTNSSYNLGNYVQDISIQPYISQAEIAFYAWGVRPNTKLYATFDGVPVVDSVAPGVRNPAVNDTTSSDYVTRTAPYGSPLVSDAAGTVYGKFLIPAAKFRVGERNLRLTDVARVSIGENSLTTSASASYTASNFTVTNGSTTLSTVNPELSATGLSDAYSTTTASTTSNLTVSPDPNYVAPIPVVNNITNVTNDITNNTYLTEVTNVTNVTNNNTAVTNVYNTEVVQPTPVEQPQIPDPIPPDPPVVTDVFNPDTFVATQEFADDFMRTAIANKWTPDWYVFGDPLAQAFRVEITGGIAGMFLTYIDVYFQKKSTSQQTGCSVYMTEILNGYPDNTKVMPFSRAHLNWDQIATSEDGQTPTRFWFDSPVYSTNGKQYAFVVYPDGGDPDYVCWTAILGNNDVNSGVQVSSKPYVDTAFYSSNQQSWSALQNEFVKFNIGRASFTSLNGTAGFNAESVDYLSLTNITPVSSARTMSVGDRIYGVQGGVLNAGIAGKVAAYDVVKGKVTVSGTTGYFNNSPTVQIHRLVNDTDTPSAASLVATATISNVGNLPMNVIVPRFATISPSGTSLKPAFRGVDGNYSPDGASTSCNLDIETEMYDYERIVPGRSNEVTFANGAKLFNVTVDFHSDSTFVSPVIDLIRSNILAVYNLIDPTNFDVTSEYGNNGTVQTKYVSKVVTLANGQDAEDLKVWLTAYKPLSSKILVYGKFLSGEDPDTIIQKTWTPLDIDDDTVFSDFRNVEDYREIVFTVPKSVIGPATNAFVDPIDGLTYTSKTTAKYSSYKAFQLKIVLLSDTTARVPRLNDVRAVALQL